MSGDEIIGGYLLASHAAGPARHRGIDSLGSPPRMYLLRAVVDTDRFPLEVVTVDGTSRVDRYWRSDS